MLIMGCRVNPSKVRRMNVRRSVITHLASRYMKTMFVFFPDFIHVGLELGVKYYTGKQGKNLNLVLGQQYQYEICVRFLLHRNDLWTLKMIRFWILTLHKQNVLTTWGQRFWKVLDLYYKNIEQSSRGRYCVGWKSAMKPYDFTI